MRGTQLEIRPQALRHNAALARRLAGAVPVYAMVKANAYGHGLALAVQAMAPEVDGFGVALLEEAEALDRKSTRLNSSHVSISYAVFCLKKKKNIIESSISL